MSAPLTPAIEKFLQEWERTRGFGLTWKVTGGTLRTPGYPMCCPLTAKDNTVAITTATLPGGTSDDADRIMAAADVSKPYLLAYEPEIRRRLLEGVGLA